VAVEVVHQEEIMTMEVEITIMMIIHLEVEEIMEIQGMEILV
jgi:hypothetical protein